MDPCVQVANDNIPNLTGRREDCTSPKTDTDGCDIALLSKWYKSEYKLATKAPGINSCGTRNPIWINGEFLTYFCGWFCFGYQHTFVFISFFPVDPYNIENVFIFNIASQNLYRPSKYFIIAFITIFVIRMMACTQSFP